jgi:hypothetical protein
MERVVKLERESRLRIDDLRENEEFVSTVVQACHIAARSHQREKADALRNAVLNAAIGAAPEDSKREMFLEFVDTFTVWHLKVLAFLNKPVGWVDKHGSHAQYNVVCNTVEAALYSQRSCALPGGTGAVEHLVREP